MSKYLERREQYKLRKEFEEWYTKTFNCVETSCTSCGHSFRVALPRTISSYDYKEIQEIVSELIMSVNNPHQVVQHIVDKVCYRERVDKLESAMAEIYKLTVEQLLSGETHMLYYYPETIKGIAKEFIDKTYERV